MRAITPATNPPSSRSSPSELASAPSANTVTTATRMASWPLVSSVRSSSSQPRPTPRTAPTAAMTAITTKAIRISAFDSAPLVEKTSVISRIGPNSPIAPAASR